MAPYTIWCIASAEPALIVEPVAVEATYRELAMPWSYKKKQACVPAIRCGGDSTVGGAAALIARLAMPPPS
ncbi:hypothetical protein GCM10027034_38920 [Ramlibacter solisilvae]|uniref:Uncharacterized protein n=1 Tax=Ramlibacter tataouinensis TaxID=94132 RepID=A0A127JUA2_9BURK|nr:hypothetical protein [Ramlibacter tataouinensis]AMO23577.1 hypothetical protein UC35_12600 [Ramlibacter tataouinensis]